MWGGLRGVGLDPGGTAWSWPSPSRGGGGAVLSWPPYREGQLRGKWNWPPFREGPLQRLGLHSGKSSCMQLTSMQGEVNA
jgi:hypothetical protein